MADLKLRNLLIYIGIALANMLAIAVGAALATGTMPGFRTGELLAPATGAGLGLLAIVTPILSTWLAANRPRWGSEGLAADVGAYKELGYHRDDLTVVPKGGRVPDPSLIASPVVLTDEQVRQVADELEARLKATPSQADATLDALDFPEPGHGGRG